MEEKIYVALLHKIGISQQKLAEIFEKKDNQIHFEENYHKKYKNFYDDFSENLLLKYGFKIDKIGFLMKNYISIKIENIQKILEKRSVKLILKWDKDYPDSFYHIHNSPFILYIRWTLSNRPKLSIVGSRKMTDYGRYTIEGLVPHLWKYFDIVSWGAYGCDTHSHIISLENKIPTLSIVWTGIDEDYPVWNKKLYDRIVDNGWSIISIFPVWEPGNPYNFPIRNQLVAAISLWVVVIEAKEKSGTLITAKLALDMGKEIFAIPWEIGKSESRGCNYLIQSWQAKLTVNQTDIFDEFNIIENREQKKSIKKFADKIEEEIYNYLLAQNATTDEIARYIELDIKTISLKLSYLEITGVIKKSEGGKYIVIS